MTRKWYKPSDSHSGRPASPTSIVHTTFSSSGSELDASSVGMGNATWGRVEGVATIAKWDERKRIENCGTKLRNRMLWGENNKPTVSREDGSEWVAELCFTLQTPSKSFYTQTTVNTHHTHVETSCECGLGRPCHPRSMARHSTSQLGMQVL